MGGFTEACPCCGGRKKRDDGRHLARWSSCPRPRTATPPPPPQFLRSISAPIRSPGTIPNTNGNSTPCSCVLPPPVISPSPAVASEPRSPSTTPGSSTSAISTVELPPVVEPEKRVTVAEGLEKIKQKIVVDVEKKTHALVVKEGGDGKGITIKKDVKGRNEEVEVTVICECGSELSFVYRRR